MADFELCDGVILTYYGARGGGTMTKLVSRGIINEYTPRGCYEFLDDVDDDAPLAYVVKEIIWKEGRTVDLSDGVEKLFDAGGETVWGAQAEEDGVWNHLVHLTTAAVPSAKPAAVRYPLRIICPKGMAPRRGPKKPIWERSFEMQQRIHQMTDPLAALEAAFAAEGVTLRDAPRSEGHQCKKKKKKKKKK
eukprot:Hpha_TRINITY_DN15223_c7_g1::TRINITY_DN15223_c7_g1_i1::g.67212::m.67212